MVMTEGAGALFERRSPLLWLGCQMSSSSTERLCAVVSATHPSDIVVAHGSQRHRSSRKSDNLSQVRSKTPRDIGDTFHRPPIDRCCRKTTVAG